MRSLSLSLRGAEGRSLADCLILDASHRVSPPRTVAIRLLLRRNKTVAHERLFSFEGLIPIVLPLVHFSTTDTKFALMGEGAVLGLNPAATAFPAALKYEKQIYPARRGREKWFKYEF